MEVEDPLNRVRGVGSFRVFGGRVYSRGVWLDPNRMTGLNLTVEDVTQAIQSQNIQVAAGTIGAPPAPKGTQLQLTVNTLGRLIRPEQFAAIIVITVSDGPIVHPPYLSTLLLRPYI